jgi:hypothetical protein
VLGQSGLHSPRGEHSRRVGQTLDASADFANLGGGFEDVDAVAREEDGDGGAEASEARADYDDLRMVSIEELGRVSLGDIRSTCSPHSARASEGPEVSKVP